MCLLSPKSKSEFLSSVMKCESNAVLKYLSVDNVKPSSLSTPRMSASWKNLPP